MTLLLSSMSKGFQTCEYLKPRPTLSSQLISHFTTVREALFWHLRNSNMESATTCWPHI